MSHEFHVGQKVVCVDDGEYPLSSDRTWEIVKFDGEQWLEAGQVYTVNATYTDPIDADHCVLLREITRHATDEEFEAGVLEPGFLACRFRPLESRETDISIFKAMLEPTKAKQANDS